MNLAEDVVCTDTSMLISKFLAGLDDGLAGGLRMRVYELGAEATLEEAFELAEKVELAQRRYEAYLPKAAEKRRPTWAAVMIPGAGSGEEQRQERRTDTRTCYRCGQPGHVKMNCKNCDTCGKPGHRRRECPDAPIYDVCGKRGHQQKDCYQKTGGPRRSQEDIANQIEKLQARLQAMGGKKEKEAGLYTREEEEEEREEEERLPEHTFLAMCCREEMGLRSGGKDGRKEHIVKERGRPKQKTEEESEGDEEPARHPKDRLASQATVLVAEAGTVTVGGEIAKTAILDTGAQSVMLGKRLAQKLGLTGQGQHIKRGMLVMTAEGGEPKWLPCTKTPVEVVLMPGRDEQTSIRLSVGSLTLKTSMYCWGRT
ncbi:unnamed protein product [Closterium sp. NIES-53]